MRMALVLVAFAAGLVEASAQPQGRAAFAKGSHFVVSPLNQEELTLGAIRKAVWIAWTSDRNLSFGADYVTIEGRGSTRCFYRLTSFYGRREFRAVCRDYVTQSIVSHFTARVILAVPKVSRGVAGKVTADDPSTYSLRLFGNDGDLVGEL